MAKVSSKPSPRATSLVTVTWVRASSNGFGTGSGTVWPIQRTTRMPSRLVSMALRTDHRDRDGASRFVGQLRWAQDPVGVTEAPELGGITEIAGRHRVGAIALRHPMLAWRARR